MRIVALVDRSLYAQSVIDHTAWLAAEKDAGVDLVQIVSPNELMAERMPPAHPGGPVVITRDKTLDDEIAERHQSAHRQLEKARLSLAARGVRDVGLHVLEGGAVSHLMAEATADASVVVIGKRGEHADLAHLPLGANFEPLIRASRAPVLAISRTFRPIDNMLLAIDFDPAAAAALEAVAAGLLPQMPVHLLHVGTATEVIESELARAALRLESAGYAATTDIADGLPRLVVPMWVVAESIDLVVMGAFGSSRLKSLIFGSLTAEVIRACQVPILLCR
jgi:nucleotide-binding universal stress UspA family protein